MNLTVFASEDSVFADCECIKGYAFEIVAPRGKSVYLADDFAAVRGESALLTADFAALRNGTVHSTVLNASRHKYRS